jgi:acid stress-induced BolA-like protein IbaG/YrbA
VSQINEAIRESILSAIPDALVEVEGNGGHFVIEVTSQVFEGKSLLAKQRLVLRAIKELMAGDAAPVHAVDTLITKLPGE